MDKKEELVSDELSPYIKQFEAQAQEDVSILHNAHLAHLTSEYEKDIFKGMKEEVVKLLNTQQVEHIQMRQYSDDSTLIEIVLIKDTGESK